MAAERMREIKISLPEELFTLFLPSSAQEHLIKAKKEMLLALRSLIDARLEHIDKEGRRKTVQKKKIKIE